MASSRTTLAPSCSLCPNGPAGPVSEWSRPTRSGSVLVAAPDASDEPPDALLAVDWTLSSLLDEHALATNDNTPMTISRRPKPSRNCLTAFPLRFDAGRRSVRRRLEHYLK